MCCQSSYLEYFADLVPELDNVVPVQPKKRNSPKKNDTVQKKAVRRGRGCPKESSQCHCSACGWQSVCASLCGMCAYTKVDRHRHDSIMTVGVYWDK